VIIRWLNSLSGRLTLAIFIALIAAQLIGIVLFVSSNERDRSELTTENFMRQIAALTQLYNAVPDIDRENYLRNVRQPGLQFWTARTPVVPEPNPVLRPEAPAVPRNWANIPSPDKRLIWYPDERSPLVRYSIAPLPVARNLGGNSAPEFNLPPTETQAEMLRPPPGAPEGPPPVLGADPMRAPRPMTESISQAPEFRQRAPLGGSLPGGPPPGGPQLGGPSPPTPPPGLLPTTRWRVSVLLTDGTWLNAEHMYELGLPPWLTTVLFQSAVTLVIMLLLIVPAVALSTKRLAHLARAADKVGRGEDTEPLPESGAFEVRQLTQAFNSMSLKLRRFVQGRTQMLAGISHDLRTPITALRLRADLVDDDENRERMIALIDDMHHLTEGTMTLARDDSYTEKTDKVDLSSLVEGICDDLTDAGIDATAEVKRGVSLTCRPYSLRRAIRNLAENGAKYGSRARIKIEDKPRSVDIIIDDDGPGIPDDQIERAFLPFVRLESSRSRETGGSGLGLAITRSIILNHGGDIALSNRPEGGLRATITLPKPNIE
jgi:signal transduction histidine kinase